MDAAGSKVQSAMPGHAVPQPGMASGSDWRSGLPAPPLFREQALAGQMPQTMGGIVLARPLSFTFLSLFAALVSTGLCFFLAWSSYTQRSTVIGQLLPDSGLIKVHAPQPGIVVERRVEEGEEVKEGQVLYVVSSERQASAVGSIQASISGQVEQRQISLRAEVEKAGLLYRQERDSLQRKIAALRAELAQLNAQIGLQEQQVSLAQAAFGRHQDLLQRQYISPEMLERKQEALLEQQSRRQALERERLGIERELSGEENVLASLPLKHQNQVAQLERLLSQAAQELSESEGKRRLLITAPQSGTVAAVVAEPGQTVDGGRPLLSIVPRNARLHAALYAPSRAIGFVKPGDRVLIRYQAYPYQKFGHHAGTVQTVSRTALPAAEFSIPGLIETNANEPLYRIHVRLDEQAIHAYGRLQVLQAGMLLEADILQETRRLYEWLLEPLYSISGKMRGAAG